MSKGNVLLIGLNPAVVNYEKWPGLTAEKLEMGLRRDESSLNELGYSASICFIDHGDTAESTITEALQLTRYDCILIGAGVRTDSDEFLLFEKAINLIHRLAPPGENLFQHGAD